MSLRLAALNRICRGVIKPVLRRTKEPAAARRDLELVCRLFLHGPRHTARQLSLNGISTLEISPPKPRPDAAIFYLHGGGYVAGSPRTHRPMMARLAAMTGVRVYRPDYRLAPEHPCPAAFDDALAAWQGLPGPGRIILGGDSAGGGLALALLAHLIKQNETRVQGAFAFSPWTDLALTGTSLDENAARDVLLPVDRITELVGMVVGGTDPHDPRISPFYADFTGAPPVYLQVGETEILRDDTLRLVSKLVEQGVAATADTWPDAPHVWQMLDGWVPESRAALSRVAAFVETRLSPPPPRPGN